MRLIIAAVTSLLALGATAQPSWAKDPTRKLIISSGGLAGMVEIVDSATLALSDVYSGKFLGATSAIPAPPSNLPRYQISFYLPRHSGLVDFAHRSRLQVAYVVYYVPDADHVRGYIYVPGEADT